MREGQGAALDPPGLGAPNPLDEGVQGPLTLAGFGAEPRPSSSPDRLYGRKRGHALRARQLELIAQTLPRLRYASGFGVGASRRWLEIGFGGGEHLEALVRAHPDDAFVGAEVFRNGLCSLLGRLVPQGGETTAAVPANLRLWDEDARLLIRALPDGWLDVVCLMFPDPWPKHRHEERRFVGAASITALARVLRAGGEWRIASDDPTYQQWVGEQLAGQGSFAAASPVRVRPEGWPATRYEAKALRAGRTPFYWSCTRL